MEKDRSNLLDILINNKGFDKLDDWVQYAHKYNFQKVKAEKITACPDCGKTASFCIGQYIYYSTLIKSILCTQCGLIFSDTHIDPEILKHHFEISYKDEKYFDNKRSLIFNQIIDHIDMLAPASGKVIDIGGAKGNLLAKLHDKRCDLRLTLNDISENACNYANKHHKIETICCTIPELASLPNKYDVVLMIDVIYYESDIRRAWETVWNILNDSGILIIRIPNKISLIRASQIIRALLYGKESISYKSSIKFYNPEHIYILSKEYINQRLKKLGFCKVSFIPSPMLLNKQILKPLYSFYYSLAQLINNLTFEKITPTPSILVIANKRQ